MLETENKKIENKKARSWQEGFTLVELMVVVAIIGVLATLAIPQYQRFTAKARQSEARIALGAMRTAIESYRPENGMTGCLRQAGYTPAQGRTFYATGITTAQNGVNNCGPNTTLVACNIFTGWNGTPITCASTDWQFAATVGEGGGPAAGTGNIGGLAVGISGGTTYVLGAGGNIRNGAGFDQWTINQTGITSNSQPGI